MQQHEQSDEATLLEHFFRIMLVVRNIETFPEAYQQNLWSIARPKHATHVGSHGSKIQHPRLPRGLMTATLRPKTSLIIRFCANRLLFEHGSKIRECRAQRFLPWNLGSWFRARIKNDSDASGVHWIHDSLGKAFSGVFDTPATNHKMLGCFGEVFGGKPDWGYHGHRWIDR